MNAYDLFNWFRAENSKLRAVVVDGANQSLKEPQFCSREMWLNIKCYDGTVEVGEKFCIAGIYSPNKSNIPLFQILDVVDDKQILITPAIICQDGCFDTVNQAPANGAALSFVWGAK